jgi:hypothetical protein
MEVMIMPTVTPKSGDGRPSNPLRIKMALTAKQMAVPMPKSEFRQLTWIVSAS